MDTYKQAYLCCRILVVIMIGSEMQGIRLVSREINQSHKRISPTRLGQ